MIAVNRYVLPNGLRMIHHYDGRTQMVALNILYDVGSKDENPARTGFAHLFEHLMFGGSANIPDFDTPLQQAGGQNNAWTSSDVTNYYSVVPRRNVETAFWLESDRMLELEFSEKSLAVQKQVVCEEFKQRNLNQPYGDMYMQLRPLAYKKHPYRWPVIGKEIKHIEDATLDDVKDFYYKHYAPNNAILAVTGNIPFAEAVRLAQKWFGPIPRRDIPRRDLPAEPPQTETRYHDITRPVPLDAIAMAWHMSGRHGDTYRASDLLSDILSNGDSSRLYRRLVVEKPLFSDIDASITGDIEPGLFVITGRLNKGITMQQAEDALQHEVQTLQEQPVQPGELNKVVNKYESDHHFSNIDYLSKATHLAWYELIGKAEDIDSETDKYKTITPDHMQQVARTLFSNSNRSTLYYRAQK
ncbi:MAG: insulinase family protein [Coprobacter sp.]|nr:insulinase family protein [Coprobacter sp.]